MFPPRSTSRSACSSLSFFLGSTRTYRASTGHLLRRPAQQCKRRGYASAIEGAKQASKTAGGDLPWLLMAVGVTIPGVWYFSQPGTYGHAENEERATGHATLKDEGQGEGVKKNTASGSAAPSGEGTPAESGTTEGEVKPLEGSSGEDRAEGVPFKGPSKGGEAGGAPDARKLEPDSMGATKKRIDSGYGTPVGGGVSAGSAGDEQAQKQQGVSNTDTKHSTDISQNPEKSNKAEGTADTAKVKGTVQADRPQK